MRITDTLLRSSEDVRATNEQRPTFGTWHSIAMWSGIIGLVSAGLFLTAAPLRSPKDDGGRKWDRDQNQPTNPTPATTIAAISEPQVSAPFAFPAAAQPSPWNVSLKWDVSPDASVIGYRVYYGNASGDYTNSIAVGNTNTVTVTNLVRGATYFFAATAFDADNLESAFSNEIHWPSNAIYVPVIEASVDFTNWHTVMELPTITNEPLKFLRIKNEFKRWE